MRENTVLIAVLLGDEVLLGLPGDEGPRLEVSLPGDLGPQGIADLMASSARELGPEGAFEKLILVDARELPSRDSEQLISALFQLGFPAITCIPASFAVLLASGMSTGVVVLLGRGLCHVSVFYDGLEISRMTMEECEDAEDIARAAISAIMASGEEGREEVARHVVVAVFDSRPRHLEEELRAELAKRLRGAGLPTRARVQLVRGREALWRGAQRMAEGASARGPQ